MQNHYMFPSVSAVMPGEFESKAYFTQQPSAAQPFGALGGAVQFLKHTGVCLTQGRINTDYSITAMQNAHVILTSSAIPVDRSLDSPVDGVSQVLAYASATAAVREALHASKPTFIQRKLEIQGEYNVQPSWLPASGVGRYGKDQFEILSTLKASQVDIAAFELAVADSLSGNAMTSVAGIGTVWLERSKNEDWRWADLGEGETVFSYAIDYFWPNEAEPEIPVCEPGTAWLLKDRVAAWREKAKEVATNGWKGRSKAQVILEMTAQPVQAGGGAGCEVPAPPVMPDMQRFWHLATVIGHPTFKGAGAAVVREACKLGDATGMAVVVEAVPSDGLSFYYAIEHGFKLAAFRGSIDRAKLLRQGYVLMVRPPAPQTGAGVAMHPDLAALLSTATTQPEQYTGKQTTPTKLRWMHLAVPVEKEINAMVAWNKRSVAQFATWAKEVHRQAVAGCLAWPGGVRNTAAEEVEKTEAAAAVVRAEEARRAQAQARMQQRQAVRAQAELEAVQKEGMDSSDDEDGAPVPTGRSPARRPRYDTAAVSSVGPKEASTQTDETEWDFGPRYIIKSLVINGGTVTFK